jgi:hypothetical protein
VSSLIDALLSGPPRTPTRLFFSATVEDWHYAADGYIGDVGFDDRVARLAAHVGETALVTESHRLEYCADPNDASTCLRSLKDHLSGDFSACNLTSAVTASYFEFRDVGDASAMELASFLHDEAIALAPLLSTIELSWSASTEHESVATAEQNAVVITDSLIVIAALGIVLVLLVLQLRVAFTAVLGWLQILLCFPIAFSLYYGVVGVGWFGTLNFISLFVIFGIGADDVFVFAAAWRTSLLHCAESDLVGRMRHALPHAAGSMFATSATTAAAFFANSVSLIPPIKLFGIFAGIMVIVLYIMVVPGDGTTAAQPYGCCCLVGLSLLTGATHRRTTRGQKLATTQSPCLTEVREDARLQGRMPVATCTPGIDQSPELQAETLAKAPLTSVVGMASVAAQCTQNPCLTETPQSSTPVAACTPGIDQSPELQAEPLAKAPLTSVAGMAPVAAESTQSPRLTNVGGAAHLQRSTPVIPELQTGTPAKASLMPIAGMTPAATQSRQPLREIGLGDISEADVSLAKGRLAPGSCKTRSTTTGGASDDENAFANQVKAKTKPKRQAKAKGRRQQRKPPAAVSVVQDVFLEEIQIRPGDGECFCIKCQMQPSMGGLPTLSLVEALSGGRHSTQQFLPREKKTPSGGHGQTRGNPRLATGKAGLKAPTGS